MSLRVLLFTLLVAAAVAIGAETLALTRARERFAAEQRQASRLEAQTRTILDQLAANDATQKTAGEKLAALQVSAAAKETRNAQAILWRNRIKALQERLAAKPDENIPELKLLGMKDWIDAVLYTDTANEEQTQKVLARLRHRARARFAAMLPEALSHFTEKSGGALPGDVLDLLPFLAPPADADMLGHYVLKRSGKIEAPDEELLTSELPDNGGVISISPSGYGFKAHPDDAEIAAGAGEDLIDALGMESLGADDELGMKQWAASLEALGPAMQEAFAPLDDAFGDRLKAAVKQFTAANDSHPPTDVSQLRGLLPDLDQLAARMRLIKAQFEYIVDHGQPADDPAKIQRYLQRPIDDAHILRVLKLTVEGEHVNMEFSLK